MAMRSNQKSGLPSYEVLLGSYHAAFSKELKIILEELPICSGDTVLDAGSGDADYTAWMAPLVAPNGQVTGVDQSSAYLKFARRKVRRLPFGDLITFKRGRIQKLPFRSNSFDVV